jgi:hypothetical protein
MPIECPPIIDIELTQEQVEYITTTLTEHNDLDTDERQLLNGLLEMAQNHPSRKRDHHPAWRYMRPRGPESE